MEIIAVIITIAIPDFVQVVMVLIASVKRSGLVTDLIPANASPKEATSSKPTMVTITLASMVVCVDGAALNKGLIASVAKIAIVKRIGVMVHLQLIVVVHVPPKEATIRKPTMVTITLAPMEMVCVDGAALNKGKVASVAKIATVKRIGVMVQLHLTVVVHVATRKMMARSVHNALFREMESTMHAKVVNVWE
jgi:hypothetical protein